MSCLISSSVISPATGDASGKRTTMSTSWSQCVKHNFVIVECEGKREIGLYRIEDCHTRGFRFSAPYIAAAVLPNKQLFNPCSASTCTIARDVL